MSKRSVKLPSQSDLQQWAEATGVRLRSGFQVWREWVFQEYRTLSLEWVAARLRREIFLSPRRGQALYVLGVLAWFSLAVWGRIMVPLATTPLARPDLGFRVIAYFENGAGGPFVDSLPALRQKGRLFDAVLPFWYSMAFDGSLVGDGFREEVMGAARSLGLRVLPMVTNHKDGQGNAAEIVKDAATRWSAVETLAGLTVERGFDGLNLYFSLLPSEARGDYTQFVRELSLALRARGRVLWVTVFPDVDLPDHVHGFLDYRALGEAADLVILTAFDRHWTVTTPGPIAPLGWVERSVSGLLTHVPARKIVLCVGTHAYDWPLDPRQGLTEYIPTRTALERAEAAGVEVQFDPESEQLFFDYRGLVGERRRVWLQEERHLAAKVSVARRFGLRGVAVWRLGFLNDEAIEELSRVARRRP